MCIVEGDHIKVTASKYSFPTVCKEDQATDWFNSLSKCLHWNKRQRQKSFAIVESNRGVQKSGPTTPKHSSIHQTLSMASSTHNQHAGYSRNNAGNGNKKGVSSTGSTTNTSRSSSPPLHQNSLKRPSHSDSSASSYTTPSSEGLPDEVFAMFIEDEYKDESDEEGDHLSESEFFRSWDEDDDDASSIEDGFNGWTDQEIIKARFSSKVALELERLSMSKAI